MLSIVPLTMPKARVGGTLSVMVSISCASASPGVLSAPNPCPAPDVASDASLPAPSRAIIQDDVESRVRRVAEGDLQCSQQQVFISGIYGAGATPDFYSAERCGSYQLYRAPRTDDTPVIPEGVDIFFVSPLSPPRIRSWRPFSARPPSSGEELLLVDRKGVVCRASVRQKVVDGVWTLDSCSSERLAVVGVVAVRATEATTASRLETHWIGQPLPSASKEGVPPWRDGAASMWQPFTVVDLGGDRTREVAVYCRRSTAEYECERFMVRRTDKVQAGWWTPVARARWAPNILE